MSVFRFSRLSVFLPIVYKENGRIKCLGIEYNTTKIIFSIYISSYLAKGILDQRTLETVPTIMACNFCSRCQIYPYVHERVPGMGEIYKIKLNNRRTLMVFLLVFEGND